MKTTKNIITLALMCGLAAVLKAQDLYVVNSSGGLLSEVDEYTTDGVRVNAPLISGLTQPLDIAISGNDLFVANVEGTVGEYTTSGATVNASLISGLEYPSGIAVSGNDLFVTDWYDVPFDVSEVCEYTTSGAIVDTSLIREFDTAWGIAISPAPEPSTGALAGLGGAALLLWRPRK